MSTKNLARTVIEGGRYRYNKWERRRSHRVERCRWREFLVRASREPDGFEARVAEKRDPVRKDFFDKLGPMRRFLRSRVGRPWDDVRSEIFRKFDVRTLAGRHIVFDHMLGEVAMPNDPPDKWTPGDLFVDDEGILREEPKRRRPKGLAWRWRTKLLPRAVTWAAGRVVRRVDDKLYWMVPTELGGFPTGRYRQHRELASEEATFFAALPTWDREQLTWKPYVRPKRPSSQWTFSSRA